MNENDQKRMFLPGVLMMLGLLLYVGTYVLARGTGQIVRSEAIFFAGGGSATIGSVVAAPRSDLVVFLNRLSSGNPPSVVHDPSKTPPWILNTIFWPLRKLETVYWGHPHPVSRLP